MSFLRCRMAVLLLLVTASVSVAQEPSAAVAMMRAARASGVPVGIVLRAGNDLCAKPDIPADKRPSDPMQQIRVLADAYGYRVDETGPVVQVMPKDGGSPMLEKALHHRWASYPAMDGVMHFLGPNLEGWMNTVADPQRGFAMSIGSSPHDPVLHLSASTDLTSQQIADRIVLLDEHGVWIAYQLPREARVPLTLQMATLSYNRWEDLDFKTFRCQ